jgi:hypothetical protein
MHLDEKRIQRLLDRELSPAEEREARQHLSGCAECRRLLAEAEREEREVNALLEMIDQPGPPVRAEAVALRAELMGAASRAQRASLLRRAAAFVLVAGIAGAAYAIPGSPLPKWVHSITEKMAGRPDRNAGPPDSRTTGVSGISVQADQRLVILFSGDSLGGQVRVTLSEGSQVQVQAPPGAATFTSKSEYLLIGVKNPAASFDVLIPRSAPWVEIRAGEDRLFLKEGQRISTSGSNSAGGYVLRLTTGITPQKP